VINSDKCDEPWNAWGLTRTFEQALTRTAPLQPDSVLPTILGLMCEAKPAKSLQGVEVAKNASNTSTETGRQWKGLI
jgi:hypothetical protein